MAFRSKSRPAQRPSTAARSAWPSALVLRTLLLGGAAIGGAAWGLYRHCTHELPPMRVPRAAPTFDADAGEIPVPDFDWGDAG